MMKLVFGDEKRLAVIKDPNKGMDKYKKLIGFEGRYKIGEYNLSEMKKPEYVIKVGPGKYANDMLSKTFVSILLLKKIFNHSDWNTIIKNVVTLETDKL